MAASGFGRLALVATALVLAPLAATPAFAQRPTVSLVRAADIPASVVEGARLRFFLIHLTRNHRPVTVNLTISDGGGDVLTGTGSMTVTIPQQNTQFPAASFEVRTDDDSTYEEASTVTVTLETGSGYDRGRDRTASVVVRDDDPLVRVSPYRPLELPVIQEGDDAAFIFSAAMTDPDAALPRLTVRFRASDSPSGGFLTSADAGDMEVTFGGGGNNWAYVGLSTEDDDVHEPVPPLHSPRGAVTVTVLPSGDGSYDGDGSSARVLVEDDDIPPRIAVWHIGTRPIREGANARFSICRYPVSGSDHSSNFDNLTIDLRVTQEGEVVDGPLSALPSSITIRAHETGRNCRNLEVPTDDDKSIEDEGSVTVTLLENDSSDYTVDPDLDVRTIGVQDNEHPALLRLETSSSVATEGIAQDFRVCRVRPASVPAGRVVLFEDLDVVSLWARLRSASTRSIRNAGIATTTGP